MIPAPADLAAMRAALAVARGAGSSADVPVGAVVVDGAGRVLAEGWNVRERDHDPTGHAEVVALRRAGAALGSWRLTGMTLAVTLEPCPMCAGAALLARVDRVVYGAPDPKAGAVGSQWDLLRDPRVNHHPQVVAGVLAAECTELLDAFFQAARDGGQETR